MQTDDPREQGFERALRHSLAVPATVAAGACVDAETLAAWSDGSLPPAQASSVELHLSSCPSCQELVAALVRTTPAQPVTVPLWRRWQLQWLVPLATATAALVVYLAIPNGTPAERAPRRADGSTAQLNAPPSGTVPSGGTIPPQARVELQLAEPPASPPSSSNLLRRPAAASSETDAKDALAKLQQQQLKLDAQLKVQEQRRNEAGGRVAAVADAKTKPSSAGLAAEAAAQARAFEERKMADAVAAAPAAAAPAAAPPPAAAIPAEPRPAAPTATAAARVPAAEAPAVPPAAARREQVAGFAQAGALKVAITEVLSPTSATRWRIAVGRPVDYFGPSSQSGRPTDIPAAPAIAAGSSPQDDVCWMVGRGGAVYLTTNGTHFARVTFPDAVDLIAVRATDATTATVTAASGRTYRTTDAGKTWQ